VIVVTEQVFKDDGTLEHTSEKQWSLKFRFLNELRKLKGMPAQVIADLSKGNVSMFVIDGVTRKIEITPQLYLGNLDE
jgi:hypothetical protein